MVFQGGQKPLSLVYLWENFMNTGCRWRFETVGWYFWSLSTLGAPRWRKRTCQAETQWWGRWYKGPVGSKTTSFECGVFRKTQLVTEKWLWVSTIAALEYCKCESILENETGEVPKLNINILVVNAIFQPPVPGHWSFFQVQSLSFSPSSSLLLAGGYDQDLVLWDAESHGAQSPEMIEMCIGGVKSLQGDL